MFNIISQIPLVPPNPQTKDSKAKGRRYEGALSIKMISVIILLNNLFDLLLSIIIF
jgi:hypothetical protein